jgi:hypothetical protein
MGKVWWERRGGRGEVGEERWERRGGPERRGGRGEVGEGWKVVGELGN